MGYRVTLDSRGRITLPKEVRNQLSLSPGDTLILRTSGGKIVLEKASNPFERLANLLGNLTFSRELRREAETEALKEARARFA